MKKGLFLGFFALLMIAFAKPAEGFAWVNVNGDMESAQPVLLDTMYHLDSIAKINYERDEQTKDYQSHFYRLELDKKTSFFIKLSDIVVHDGKGINGCWGGYQIHINDSEGNNILYRTRVHSGVVFPLALDPGVYYIVISPRLSTTHDATARCNFILESTAGNWEIENNDDEEHAYPIDANREYCGSIEHRENTSIWYTDKDCFEWTAPANGNVSVTFARRNYNTCKASWYLSVYDCTKQDTCSSSRHAKVLRLVSETEETDPINTMTYAVQKGAKLLIMVEPGYVCDDTYAFTLNYEQTGTADSLLEEEEESDSDEDDIPEVELVSAKSSTKKTAYLRWEKETGAAAVTGYEISVSTSKKFKASKTASLGTDGKEKGIAIVGLKSKKKYYFRVRPYVEKNGTVYFGEWSNSKYVKIK